jgi:hypothetical protein
MAYLYVFVDESGNNDFSSKGTRFWSVTSMVLFDPACARDALFELKRQILDEGHDLSHFHATADRQVDRDRVFDLLKGLSDTDCRVDSVIVDKRKAHPAVRVPERLYCDNVELVLRYQLDRNVLDVTKYSKVLIFLDRPSQRGKQFQAMLKALKTSLPRHLRGVPYELLFHPSASHHGLQMVDYFSGQSA